MALAAGPPPGWVAEALADAHRREWALVLAATVRVTGDLDLAEECAQDAYVDALAAWTRSGVPERPGAWLTTVARRRAVDRLYGGAGAGAAHERNALQQVYRNINTGTHHAMLDLDTTLEVQGKVLLGVEQPDAMI